MPQLPHTLIFSVVKAVLGWANEPIDINKKIELMLIAFSF
jgi:hypothetical protein